MSCSLFIIKDPILSSSKCLCDKRGFFRNSKYGILLYKIIQKMVQIKYLHHFNIYLTKKLILTGWQQCLLTFLLSVTWVVQSGIRGLGPR